MTTLTRRSLLTIACGSLAAPWTSQSRAQSAYPAGIGTLRIVIPFAAGGASDVIAQLLAESMRRRWNATVVLEHVPGGGATVGISRVADGPTDGSQPLILSLPYV